MKDLRHLRLTTFLSTIHFSTNSLAVDFVFLNEATLKKNRAVLQSDNAGDSMKGACSRLIKEADLADPFTVTVKGMTPPNGNKNDCMSISPYWWPNKSKSHGLPWVRHDGKTNLASKTTETDVGHFAVKKNLAEVWAQRDIELLYPKQ